MKICAIICEYNPFHNGHLYQINQAKRLSAADAILCLMSGNFVQRGEAAIMDKHTRAKHAVLAGADIVIELPTVFATSNAELFAKGAVHLLSAIPDVTSLCFGTEMNDKQAFLTAAKLLNDEPAEVSQKIKALTAEGLSYAKARALAWEGRIDNRLLSSPNAVLGLEYTRAILSENACIEILPLQRVGGDYKDENLHKEYASASAIRAAIVSGLPLDNRLPSFVQRDLPKEIETRLDALEKYELLRCPTDEIAKVCDCTEGLESAFKKAALLSPALSETLTSARYTSSRIRRIALQRLLGVEEAFVRECLRAPLYLHVLAAKKARRDVLSTLSNADFPLLSRAHDEDCLTGTAKACFSRDIFAENVYTLLYTKKQTKKEIFV